ncbi:hypothetical protein QAD02_008884 [Eretmocerus hayati]|uniref:Uncharacterized protein n=1 Tax=Eretmocerus hayati TaxID=131215 RepID=A0ACC2N842_9HYME|nr:hypothetical protein QAD02_008884 [Eretmocerus hayati]
MSNYGSNYSQNYGSSNYSSNRGGGGGGGGRSGNSECSVFVGNLPWRATEDDLRPIFGEIGPLVSVNIIRDRETGRSRGFAFCEYQDSETAQTAMQNLNGYDMGGRSLRVDNPSRNSR